MFIFWHVPYLSHWTIIIVSLDTFIHVGHFFTFTNQIQSYKKLRGVMMDHVRKKKKKGLFKLKTFDVTMSTYLS